MAEEKNVIKSVEELDLELKTLEEKQQELRIKRAKAIDEDPITVLEHDLEIISKLYETLSGFILTNDNDILNALGETETKIENHIRKIKKAMDFNLVEEWIQATPENKEDSLNSIKEELGYFKLEKNPSEVAHHYNFISMLYFDFDFKPEEIIDKVERDLAEVEA